MREHARASLAETMTSRSLGGDGRLGGGRTLASAARAASVQEDHREDRPVDIDIPRVRDYMDRNFVRLHPEQNVYEAIDLFLQKRITGAAVVDDEGAIVGILSEKDCLATMSEGVYENVPGGTVREYMSEVVLTVPPDMDVITLAHTFLKQVFRRLLVVEDGKLVGQITRRDLLRAIHKIVHERRKLPFSDLPPPPGVRVSALDN